MKRQILIAVGVLSLAIPAVVRADDAANALMNASHQAYYYAADGGSAKVAMVITDKKGRTREREFWMLRRDVADMGDQRYYTYFLRPADVARTTFLVHKRAEGNDDRWLYTPSVDLVTRIAAGNRQRPFFGSEFTYEDVSGRLPILDNHEILGPDTAMGRKATKVKSTPKDAGTSDWDYRLSWIDDDTKLPLREEFYKKDKLVRTFLAESIETIEEIPTAIVRTMIDDKSGGKTTITFAEITYEAPMDADQFNERLLKNPPSEYTR
ncbi:MAG TPA: outer membrane lipoprotein-sorting protein [candidate division Zixibacteria bacterium]|nr:outer membrane lipoprotein-sorting protein [candidate division Zixibacteria bacterium]